jgi:hypothetical protein
MAMKPDYKAMGAAPDREPEEKEFISSVSTKLVDGALIITETTVIAVGGGAKKNKKNPAAENQMTLFGGGKK